MHNFSISIKITRLVSNFVSFTGKKKILLALIIILSILLIIGPISQVFASNEFISTDQQNTCMASPGNNFLFLPFDTEKQGDWLSAMTSAFDHDNPNYECSLGKVNCNFQDRRIVLWYGDEAKPVPIFSMTPPYSQIGTMCYGCNSENNGHQAAKGKKTNAPKGNCQAESIREVGRPGEILGKESHFGITFTSLRKSA